MLLQAILASTAIALTSLIGVFFFGHDKRLQGIERFVVPVAVGVFLSLVLNELIPEAIESAPLYGPIVVAVGFLSFYVLSNILHSRFHRLESENCDKKSAASLILIGDAIHNLADGFILGGAFLVNPGVGIATAIGLVLHEAPQEIVEFGVLLRAGYTKSEAAIRNLFSALSVILGTLIVILVSEHISDFVWVLMAFAAGNLLYLAASELLPKIHGNLSHYHSVWHSTGAIVLGFAVMTALITWSHNTFDSHGNHESHDDSELVGAGEFCTPTLN